MCFHGGGEHLRLPQTSSCPATTEWVSSPQGKQVALGAMPRVTVVPVWAAVLQASLRVNVLGALHLPGYRGWGSCFQDN